jgi:hypothetical protein
MLGRRPDTDAPGHAEQYIKLQISHSVNQLTTYCTACANNLVLVKAAGGHEWRPRTTVTKRRYGALRKHCGFSLAPFDCSTYIA